MKKAIANIVVVLFAIWFFMSGVKPPEETAVDFHLNTFAGLPLKYDGRKKPVDTFARNMLTVLSDKQSLRLEDGTRVPAVQWLLDNISGRPEAVDHKVFRIESLDVLSSLGLEERKRFRYSYRELMPALNKLDAEARSAFNKDARQRDLFDKQVVKVANKVYLFQNIMASFEDSTAIPKGQLMGTAQRYMQLEQYSLPLTIPPNTGNTSWRPLMSTLLASNPAMASLPVGESLVADPFAARWATLLAAYRTGDTALFNETLDEYGAALLAGNPEVLHKLSFEVFYNRLGAFMKAAMLYLLVFVISCFGWLARKRGPINAALALMVCAFIPHTFAIIARCFLSGYPPVTNLYSSAIFIGWAAVLAGIVLERGYRR
ncbi:MAG: hypothetical protein U9P12_10305, partial [Verrucomicrobiota bacterium]|nr:hypothetical protein [Verrucomicrobiota bacterium]